MKIVTIIGARPQFIKAATVSRAIAEYNNSLTKGQEPIEEFLVHTGQHYDENMSDVFFEELDIPQPDYHLGIGSASHGAQTGRMLEGIEKVLLKKEPDRVLVYGDTNSTLAGALAAAKLHIPVAHVEAGLRSFNRQMPEEINRVLTDHIADMLFTPTQTAVKNLKNEGISEEKIFLVGDVMYDAALYYGKRVTEKSNILEQNHLQPRQYILTTIHRAENTDDPVRLRAIFEGLSQVAEEIPVVLPMHPRTRVALIREGLYETVIRSLIVIPPVGYLDMVMLEKNARLIATDSGGVQKEAYFYRVPCITLRGETEWVELVEAGWNVLVEPFDPEQIAYTVIDCLNHTGDLNVHLYGQGDAAIMITRKL
ncbi:MAG TPA: UDP-N-acetylglucosamine 2-epimerase (non-hydrolyzing) [Clostridiales bacterium]|jgi:UDP-GlcNAc3NAcA epimerase|nr:UDP-N-acetylglucosamine 2-epimerase (non-hydrolyzing) [Clostridiales bacterium]